MSDIHGFWRCSHCQRVEYDEHVYCGRCATPKPLPQREGFSDTMKCSIIAFLKGCMFNCIELQGINGYDINNVRKFLQSLDASVFFSFSKTKNDLKKGDQVGDEIFEDLANWFDLEIIIIHPEYTISVGNAHRKERKFYVGWESYGGGMGHWEYRYVD